MTVPVIRRIRNRVKRFDIGADDSRHIDNEIHIRITACRSTLLSMNSLRKQNRSNIRPQKGLTRPQTLLPRNRVQNLQRRNAGQEQEQTGRDICFHFLAPCNGFG